jgi:hypothetical protein
MNTESNELLQIAKNAVRSHFKEILNLNEQSRGYNMKHIIWHKR